MNEMSVTKIIKKSMNIRKAVLADLDIIMSIMSQAKAQMRRLGSAQWGGDYPSQDNIKDDIAAGIGYVACDDCGVIAYMAVSFDGEKAYDILDTPNNGMDYVVVHRLAVADRAKRCGVASALFMEVENMALKKGVNLFRVDTNFDNTYMLRIFSNLGFAYCGKVYYESGERMAYEKRLDI